MLSLTAWAVHLVKGKLYLPAPGVVPRRVLVELENERKKKRRKQWEEEM